MEFEPPVICWQLKVLKSSVVGPDDSQVEFDSQMIWWQSNVSMFSVVGLLGCMKLASRQICS